jgi:hypothetical protein
MNTNFTPYTSIISIFRGMHALFDARRFCYPHKEELNERALVGCEDLASIEYSQHSERYRADRV